MSPSPPKPPKLPSLWLKDEDYLRCHRALRKFADEWQVIQKWMAGSKMFQFLPDESRRILSVGCGSGEMDIPWLERLQADGLPFSYHAVDPNARSLESFDSAVGTMLPEARQALHLYPEKFEDFSTASSFDRIIFMHSLYHFADRTKILAKAAGLLTPQGRMLVCLSDDDGLPALKASVYARVDMPAQSQTTPGGDLRTSLAELPLARGIFLRVEQTEIEVTECFNGTAEGLALLDFFFLCRFSRLEGKQKSVALDELLNHSTERQGRRYLRQSLLFAEIGGEETTTTPPCSEL